MPTFITTCPTTSSVNKWTLTYRTCFIKFKPTSSLIPISVRSVRSVCHFSLFPLPSSLIPLPSSLSRFDGISKKVDNDPDYDATIR